MNRLGSSFITGPWEHIQDAKRGNLFPEEEPSSHREALGTGQECDTERTRFAFRVFVEDLKA